MLKPRRRKIPANWLIACSLTLESEATLSHWIARSKNWTAADRSAQLAAEAAGDEDAGIAGADPRVILRVLLDDYEAEKIIGWVRAAAEEGEAPLKRKPARPPKG